MGIQIENNLFDELEISLAKGVPGMSTGGWVPRQSGGPPPPEGECFAPHGNISRVPVKIERRHENHKKEHRK